MGVDAPDVRLPVPVLPWGPFKIFALRVHELTVKGRSLEALAAADAFERVVRAVGDERTLWMITQGRMYALQALGRHEEALAAGRQLVRQHRRVGSVVGEAKTEADLAESLIRLGRLEEGLQRLARSTALLEHVSPEHVRYVSAMSSVSEAARTAELYELADESARVYVATFLDTDEQEAGDLQRAELLLEWALRLEHVGREEDATRRYRQVARTARYWVERLDGQGGRHESPLARSLLVVALAKLGLVDEAAAMAGALVRTARENGHYHEARLAHLGYGVCLRERGDLAAARREFVAAEELAVQLGQESQRLIFALFLRTDLEHAAYVAERIRASVDGHDWTSVAPGLRVTVSLGAAALRDGMSGRHLFDAADRQLYAAKRRGRNRLAA